MIVADPVYSPTRTENYLKEFNIKTVFIILSLKLYKITLQKTKLIFVENPGSNTFDFQDLKNFSYC